MAGYILRSPDDSDPSNLLVVHLLVGSLPPFLLVGAIPNSAALAGPQRVEGGCPGCFAYSLHIGHLLGTADAGTSEPAVEDLVHEVVAGDTFLKTTYDILPQIHLQGSG